MAIPQMLTVLIVMMGEDGYRAFEALERAGMLVRQANPAMSPSALAKFAAEIRADVIVLPITPEGTAVAAAFRALPRPPALVGVAHDAAVFDSANWPDEVVSPQSSDAELTFRVQRAYRSHQDEQRNQQTNSELRDSIRYLHQAFSAAPVGIAYCDPKGLLLLTNKTLRDMIGLSDAEISASYGRPVFTCPVFGEQAHTFFGSDADLGPKELCYTSRDGRDVCLDVAGLPVDNAGIPQGVVLVFNDVTQRKRMEEAEQEHRRLAEALRLTGTALARTLDSDAVMNLILANVGTVVPHRAANIMLLSADKAHILFSRGYTNEEQQQLEAVSLRSEDVPLFVQMTETKQPVVVPDTASDSNWKWTGIPWVRSWMGAPILAYNRVVGFINLDSDESDAFKTSDIERLRAFTDQAAIAIENAQMFDAAYRDAHEMRTLHRATSFLFASSVFTSDNMAEIARRIAETVVGEFGQVNCGVVVVSDVSSELIWLAQAGEYARTAAPSLFLDGPGLIPEAVRTGQVVYVPNVEVHPSYVASSPLTRSELVIPLRTTKGVYGALDMQSTDVDAFDEQDRHVLLAFAERAAAAIENMRIYSDIQRRVRERTMELNRVKERAEAILNHSSDAILLMRSDARVQQTNRAFNDMFGFMPDEVYNQSFEAIANPEYAQLLHLALEDVVVKRWPQRVEVAVRRHNGTSFEADVMMSPILNQPGGQVTSIVCSLRDITQRKQMERELRDALMKERELSEFKSRFISRASHEFRTPLAMIATSSDLLKSYNDRMTDEQRVERIERIQTEITHLTAMLDDLLSISKAQEVGTDSLHATPFDLGALFDDIVDDMRTGLGMDHHFEINREPGTFDYVGDRKLLRRALVNLISNALKYSDPGTRIGVSLSHTANALNITVEDTGIGIPEADQEQLFEPFHRGGNVANISGTGLGLAIVKQVVDLHGGEIAVESSVRMGSRFTITLPYEPEQAEVEV
ncbi:MAG: PAS domain S-box protein [Anaerolineae bacterium]